MSRAASNARTKFYLAVFATGMLVSGTILGVEVSRRLSVSADVVFSDIPPAYLEKVRKGEGDLDQQPDGTYKYTPKNGPVEIVQPIAATPPAGTVRPLEPIQLTNYFRADSLQEVILKTIPNFLLGFVGLVAMAVFLLSALRYLLSSGNADATGEAKTGMIYAGVGIGVVVLAYAIINTAAQLLGGS